jgi:anti-sigma B factor antagonist
MELQLSTADQGGGVATVEVAGEVDLSTAPALKEALLQTIEGGARRVLVDLSHATFIDSTTLGVLMGAVKRLRPAGGELAIACNDPNIRKIFEITLLDRIFEIYATPEEALKHLAAGNDPSPAKLND